MNQIRKFVLAAGTAFCLATSAQAAMYDTFSSAGGSCSLNNGKEDVICDGSGLGIATLSLNLSLEGPRIIAVTLFGEGNLNSQLRIYNSINDIVSNDPPLASTMFRRDLGRADFSFSYGGANLSSLVFATSNSRGMSHFQGILRSATVTIVTPVPGPIAGAGLPALMALGGFVWARRRKAVAAA